MISAKRAWAEINLQHIAHNVRSVRRHVPATASLIAITKADGYGHGSGPVSQTALENGASALGVATVEEGLALRECGIQTPILLLGYTPEGRLQAAFQNRLSLTVYDHTSAAALLAKAEEGNFRNIPIHIKIDSGMNRLGFLPTDESRKQILELAAHPRLSVQGLFTHYAFSDTWDRGFTLEQYSVFSKFIQTLRAYGLHAPCHASNSGGIITMPENSLDFVRPGIILYGLTPSPEVGSGGLDLRPAMTLKTIVVQVRDVPGGETIGYGRTYRTEGTTRVANVAIGYADGYPRLLSNQGHVLIRGRFAPLVGRISMDQCIVDVTHIPGVIPGDEAVLIGRQGENEISAEEIAAATGTIGYEIVCGIGKRVPREYS